MDPEKFILDSLQAVGNVDFTVIIQYFAFSFVILWFVIVMWVWGDAKERIGNGLLAALSALLVAVFNVFGLITYLILRPRYTKEEIYWADLERRYLKYETAELLDCPECGFELRPGFNVCPNCAQILKVECKGCEVMVDIDWIYCPYCGAENDLVEGEAEESKNIAKAEFKPKVLMTPQKDKQKPGKNVAVKDKDKDNTAEGNKTQKESLSAESQEETQKQSPRPKKNMPSPLRKVSSGIKQSVAGVAGGVKRVGDKGMSISAKLGNRVIKGVVGFGGRVDSVVRRGGEKLKRTNQTEVEEIEKKVESASPETEKVSKMTENLAESKN